MRARCAWNCCAVVWSDAESGQMPRQIRCRTERMPSCGAGSAYRLTSLAALSAPCARRERAEPLDEKLGLARSEHVGVRGGVLADGGRLQ